MNSVVVTTVNPPTPAMVALAEGCRENGWPFIVIGDEKGPVHFELEGADFFSLERQLDSGLAFARQCPTRHYARKNIGYLLAIRGETKVIVETDDDNIPTAGFWTQRCPTVSAALVDNSGWVNAYRYFTDANIWPRGLPLDHATSTVPLFEKLPEGDYHCPIQQGLADDNPDVDAIYRLVLPLPQRFRTDRAIALGNNAACPFNSQNTTWWPEAFPLLYLPAYCSFRMTDIWRSFVAQRIAWANGWNVLFHGPTVYQDRNEHNLMADFAQEISGYLNNDRIMQALMALPLQPGAAMIPENMRMCYRRLVEMELIEEPELKLLDAWLSDLGL